ncbi:hypothetical protein [Shewanella algae]|jgi:hypothetical protein|uniref:hypothetical protein n=1 Tax=Shewanella algae TaxID=38313 RepID=UPI00271F66E2|nr:hypothetical protein [Shewanella algae]MDO8256657.1 hypothetical protein [Shewanella algae]
MITWIKFEWVFISWIISLFIYHNSTKRAAISTQKDALIDLLISLSEFKWFDKHDEGSNLEERYNAKVSRIDWKLKQLNQLTGCKFMDEEKLAPLYNFDIEIYSKKSTKEKTRSQMRFKFQDECQSIVDVIENNHFNRIVSSKTFFIWSARHTMFGILTGLGIIYLFIEIMSFFFK